MKIKNVIIIQTVSVNGAECYAVNTIKNSFYSNFEEVLCGLLREFAIMPDELFSKMYNPCKYKCIFVGR